MNNIKPVRVLAFTSGKGGVGKTNVSVNIGIALSQMGQRVVLMDGDMGLANVDILLGVYPQYNLSHVLSGEKH
jgi:ATPases involved in chromosome partitioning